MVGENSVTANLSNSQQWIDCLSYVKHRIKKHSFNTWLKSTTGEPGSNGDFKVAVPNQFVADWIHDHFRDEIDEALLEITGKKHELIYVITGTDEAAENQTRLPLEPSQMPEIKPPVRRFQNNLDSRYRFKSLVVGDFNEFVHAAAMAVADAPGMTRYNPLYIYGGTGLGKTHIMHAIGHHILDQFPNKRVLYATSEKFTSDFIASISERSTAEFTRMYRDVDLLLIDDIQFLAGKESTQEQFFHTFNVLYHSGKQIILTSDRSPRDIKGLEDRLLSRFSWGLVTDLQAPDLENRTAILYKKLEAEGLSIPDECAMLIADQISTNIRELEGALTRLLAFASIKKKPVDAEMTKNILADIVSNTRKTVTVEVIQKKTSEHFEIQPDMLKAKKKTANIALARQVAMYLCRTLTDSTLKSIGTAFGGRDHSTVIHACEMITERMSTDPSFRDRIDRISASLLY
jgi:chromosomal replication initiator protein